MQIELRHLKIVHRLSQETVCFTASLFLDGEPAGTVSNRGDGGAHEYSSSAAESRLTAYAKAAPARTFPAEWGGGTYQPSADSLIDDLVTDHQTRADLAKLLKTRVLFTGTDGKLRQTRTFKAEELQRLLPDLTSKPPADWQRILNTLPFDEALAIFRAA
jgi:hypothetical protein